MLAALSGDHDDPEALTAALAVSEALLVIVDMPDLLVTIAKAMRGVR